MKEIIVKGVDGLGSNIMTLYCALYVSNVYKCDIYVDWRHDSYSNNDKNMFDSFFKHSNIQIIKKDFYSEKNLYYPKYWNNDNINKQTKLCKNIKNVLLDTDKFEKNKDKFDTIVIINKFTIKGFYDWFSNIEKIQLKPKISKIVDKYTKSKFDGKYIIGVHYRHGNGELKNKRLVDVQNEYYKKIDEILENIKTKNYIIFISSDNLRIIYDFINKYNKKAIYYYKWYPMCDNGGTLHNNKYCPDQYKNIKDAIIDMHILSKVHSLVCPSNSWFSKLAIHFSKIKQKVHKINTDILI